MKTTNQTRNHKLTAMMIGIVLACGVESPSAQPPPQIVQQAYIKASNTGAGDFFGRAVALSGDTIVVGSIREDSSAIGINGDQGDNDADDSGAVYILVRNGTNWTQQAYLKASNTEDTDLFGFSVAISGDTIVVGAQLEDSSASAVNGNQSDNGALNSGAAYVFERHGTNWTQQAYLKASNTGAGDFFGVSVDISGDTIAVGASGESSKATGVNGNEDDDSATQSGAAYIFVRIGTNWSQQAYLKASNTGLSDLFGSKVAIWGDTLVVAARLEDSNSTGVNGNQSNESAFESGAAYVYVRDGVNWTQQAYLKASNTGMEDGFGWSVAISDDTVVVGAHAESSNATGVNGNQTNENAMNSGAAYVFVRSGAIWSQQAYLKASNTQALDWFGESVALSGDTAIISAYAEDSNATGVDGNQNDNSASVSGAAYVFVRNGTNWSQQAYLKASNTGGGTPGDAFGVSVAVSGNTVVVGAPQEDSNAAGVNGNQANNNTENSGAAYVFTGIGQARPVLHLTAARTGGMFYLTATSATNTQWRLEYCDAITGGSAWQTLTNITVGLSPITIQHALTSSNRSIVASECREFEERSKFLHEACANDPSLRAAVEVLLQNHKEDAFLETPPTVALSSGKTMDDRRKTILIESVGERPGDTRVFSQRRFEKRWQRHRMGTEQR